MEAIKGNELHVSGIDLVDGTPILDIKPYVPCYDSRPLSAGLVAPAWLADAAPAVCPQWSLDEAPARPVELGASNMD